MRWIMKKYYQTLKNENKQKIKKEYQKEYQNTELQTRFTRLNIYIILAFLSALILLVLSYKYEDNHVYSIIVAIILILTGLTFIIGKYMIKINLLNKIALKNKNSK